MHIKQSANLCLALKALTPRESEQNPGHEHTHWQGSALVQWVEGIRDMPNYLHFHPSPLTDP